MNDRDFGSIRYMSKRVRDCVSLARFVIALAYQTGDITLHESVVLELSRPRR